MTDATALLDELLELVWFISSTDQADRAAAIVKELRSCAPQWRTMESAPVGILLLLYWPSTKTTISRMDIDWIGDCPDDPPTAWQPLPLPPSNPTLEGK